MIDDDKNSDTDGKLKKQEQLKANLSKDKPSVNSEVLTLSSGKEENKEELSTVDEIIDAEN